MVVLRQYLSLAAVFHLLVEATLFFLAFVAAVGLQRHGRGLADGVVVPALVFAGLMVVASGVVGLLRLHGQDSFARLTWRTLGAAALGLAGTYVALSAVPAGTSYQPVLLEASVIALFGLLALRTTVFHSEDALATRVLVVGAGDEAVEVEAALNEFRHGKHVIVGFVPVTGRSSTLPAHRLINNGVLPLNELVPRLRVTEIIVAVKDQRGGSVPMEDLLQCRLAGIRVYSLENVYERLRGRVHLESVKGSWLIYGDGFRQNWFRNFEKRAVDICASVVLLVLSLPVMLLTALAILIESGAPVLYRQERVGRGGRTFVIWKFRSMRTDAEGDGVARWAQAGDSRVTRVGRFIRKTRIDELPQLFNVLVGDMSLVGPRPERPPFVEDLAREIPFYNARHSVKPGVTGWAQVRYTYGASREDAKRKLEYDLYYVKNHTLLLDVLILLETVRVVLLGQGAR